MVPQHPDCEDICHNGQPRRGGQDGLQRRDAAGVDDPVVLVREQPAMDDFQRIAFVARDDALAFPHVRLVLVLANRAAQQIVVKLGLEPHRFADQEAAEFESDLLGAGTVGGTPGEARQTDGLQILRHAHGDFAQKGRRGTGDGFEHPADRIARERRFARQHFEHQAAEGKHVRCGSERFGQGLLRRRVKRRALEAAPLPAGFFEREREAKIQNARPHVRSHDDVVRLQIAMNQPGGVGRGKSARHFAQQTSLLFEVELRREAVEREPFDKFHHDGRRIGFIEHRKNRDDGGIAEGGGVARFVEDALAHLRIAATTQDFDGYTSVELLVMGRIDDAKPALPEFAFHAKARQAWQLLLVVGGRAALSLAQFAHVQAGLDALVRFAAQRFGQLRDELLDVFIGWIGEGAQKSVRVRGRIHDGGAGRGGRRKLEADRGCGRRRVQEISRVIMCAEERLDFAQQHGVIGAALGQQPGARAAPGQFYGLGEHALGIGGKVVHRGIGRQGSGANWHGPAEKPWRPFLRALASRR